MADNVREALDRWENELLHDQMCPTPGAPCTCQQFADLALVRAHVDGARVVCHRCDEPGGSIAFHEACLGGYMAAHETIDTLLATRATGEMGDMTPAEMSWRDLQHIATLQMQLATAQARVAELTEAGKPGAFVDGMFREAEARGASPFSSRHALTWFCNEVDTLRTQVQKAGALHLADESTIAQIERQVDTLRHMWAVLHRALCLPAETGVNADMVVERLRALETQAVGLRVMLRKLEWTADADGWSCCPECRREERHLGGGHAPDCALAALLTPAPPAPEAT